MKTTKIALPAIPNRHDFQYKHYFITRDKKTEGKFHLYLWAYEPAFVEVNDNSCIEVFHKYGAKITQQRYTYSIGQKQWNLNNTVSGLLYSDFADTLVYNNFSMDFGNEQYEKNPLPDDQVIPAVKPQFPGIPNRGEFQYKHYFIMQNKTYLDSYYLYLWNYEPAFVQINDKDYVEVFHKYGAKITQQRYTYSIGQKQWNLNNTVSGLLYSDFTDTLVYNNFSMDFGNEQYEKNPLPDDQVIPAVKPQFPGIPNRGEFQYKHYFIMQNKTYLDSYYLYLWNYEPAFVQINDKDYVEVFHKYGAKITQQRYTYSIGQKQWNLNNTVSGLLYSDFTDTLVYNNFSMDFGNEQYEKNPLPDDQVIPAVKPQFPGIPNRGKFQYKHYFIMQNKTYLDSYYLYLLDYEPAFVQVNDKGYIEVFHKYGAKITQQRYTYSIGQEQWTLNNTISSLLYSDFSNALVYNNFPMDVSYDYYAKNALPDDGIVPALIPEFPPIPEISEDENTFAHYLLSQDPVVLERYTLYLLKEKPYNCQVTEKGILQFLNREDKAIEIRQYSYTLGSLNWNNSKYISGINTAYINHFIDFCNFDIKATDLSSGSKRYCIEAPSHSYPKDGTGIECVRNGWTKINGKWYYYENGIKQSGWLKSVNTRSDATYYLARSYNGQRVEDELKSIEGSRYLFDQSGIMVTSNQKKDDIIFIIRDTGKVTGQEPECEYYYPKTQSSIKVYDDINKKTPIEVATFNKTDRIKAVLPLTILGRAKGEDRVSYYIKVYYDGEKMGWVLRAELIEDEITTEGSGEEIDDYFVINKKSTLKIRSTQSAKDETNILKEVAPGKAVKVVKPREEVQKDSIPWLKVYVDENKTEVGWANKTNIYPNVPFVTDFDETNYSLQNGITGTVDGKDQKLSMIWGLCGRGDYGQQEVPKDSQGRYAVAVGPRILYKDYPDTGKCEADDFNGFSRHIEVELKHKDTGSTKIIKCLVSDIKAHTYGKYPDNHSKKDDTIQNAEFPVENGIIQTGIRYPNATNNDVIAENYDGSVIEFKGGKFSDFKLMDYNIVKVAANTQRTDLFIDMSR